MSGTLGDGPAEALLSTLTRSQAAMVKKRLDNYTQTMRKRNKQPMRHVRDVFSTPDSSVSQNLSNLKLLVINNTTCLSLDEQSVCGNFHKNVPLKYRTYFASLLHDLSDTKAITYTVTHVPVVYLWNFWTLLYHQISTYLLQ